MGKGWRNESRRHSLARKGIKTAQKIPKNISSKMKMLEWKADKGNTSDLFLWQKGKEYVSVFKGILRGEDVWVYERGIVRDEPSLAGIYSSKASKIFTNRIKALQYAKSYRVNNR